MDTASEAEAGPSGWPAVIALAHAQRGVIAVRQAVALGVARTTLLGRVRREGWPRPHRSVVVLPGTSVDATVTARAAALAIGDHAVVTGESALRVHGITDPGPPRPHLVVPHTSTANLTTARVTRTRTLVDGDHRLDHGVRMATPARAMLDAAARAGLPRLRQWLIDGRQRRKLDVAEVARRAVAAVSTPGRGRLLAACRDVDASGADSSLVAEVERRLRADGFDLDVPPRVVSTPQRVLHPDLTLRGVPVALEVDGYGTHSSRRSLDLDQRKHNAYALAGWVVLRIGWTRLHDDWSGFVAELRRAMVARSDG